MRHARTLVPLLAAALLLAVPASAKEGVRAELIKPAELDLTGTPGERTRVEWRLRDEEGTPFGAGGIYLRVSRCGRKPLRIAARELGIGRYSATFRMPRRGVRKLMVGLEGWRSYPSGRTERADAIFNFVPAIGRRCG